LRGGLQDLAEDLEVERIGPQHQAGSDSLLTLHTFFKMKKLFFEDYVDDEKYGGVLYGLGISWTPQYPANSAGNAQDGHLLNTPTMQHVIHHHHGTHSMMNYAYPDSS